MKLKLTQNQLTLLVTLFLAIFFNLSFFKKVLEVYPFNSDNIFFLGSLFVSLVCAINLLLSLFRVKAFIKGSIMVLFFLSSFAAYVMDTYGIAIDEMMLLGALRTNSAESKELLTFKMLLYFAFLFLLPSWFIYKVKVETFDTKSEILLRLKSLGITTLIFVVTLFSFGKSYATFFRAHKPLRYYTNPTYYLFSMGKLAAGNIQNPNREMQAIGADSIIPEHDNDRELIILVIGETARRDRFSLNGYKKETNPLLKKENVFSFTNVTSCGTSTAVSVPCLFSNLGREKFDVDDARYTENLLDVLKYTKQVNILWRDNNSNSRGVADRVKYEDFRVSSKNTLCDEECRDEGMLVGLQEHIDQAKEKDIVIVLHQLGNHGPAYYKRVPKKFEVFMPICKTNELSQCSNEEINNAYDNAILYTDYFLSNVIQILKNNSVKFHTAMLYVSDHGESLGENGIYLHSMPYMIAPKEQVEVPFIMWFGGKIANQMDYEALRKILNEPFSHDNFFHTVLGLLEVKSSVYVPTKDILHRIQKHE